MSSRMNPRQVEAFRTVMLTGGITLAADMMGITQPAASKLIKDFEATVGLRLFDREGGKLKVRDEAVKLYREVEPLYHGLDAIGRAAEEIRQSRGGAIRIAGVPTLSAICEKLLRSFTKRLPDTKFVLETESSINITRLVAAHQFDLGLIFGGVERKGLPTEVLAESKAIALVKKGHPLLSTGVVTIADLARERAVIPGGMTPLRVSLEQAAAREGVVFRSPVETSLRYCCSMAADGVGIGVSDQLTFASGSYDVEVLPFEPAIDVFYLAIRPPQTSGGTVIEEIVKETRSALRDVLRTARSRLA